jgi:hypothetical protein
VYPGVGKRTLPGLEIETSRPATVRDSLPVLGFEGDFLSEAGFRGMTKEKREQGTGKWETGLPFGHCEAPQGPKQSLPLTLSRRSLTGEAGEIASAASLARNDSSTSGSNLDPK